eukprot:SAG31_NODE_4344_length_3330_cov_1.716496_6_plen_71_part_00
MALAWMAAGVLVGLAGARGEAKGIFLRQHMVQWQQREHRASTSTLLVGPVMEMMRWPEVVSDQLHLWKVQ